jgi:hypothetical protein
MNEPHTHAEVIKAWADGAEIETLDSGRWRNCADPQWFQDLQYRVRPTPHKWQKEIDAWAAGKTVQYRNTNDAALKWNDWGCKPPNQWVPHCSDFSTEYFEWRIKPEKVTHEVCINLINSPTTHILGMECGKNFASLRNVRFTFEDGQLVGAEVIRTSN